MSPIKKVRNSIYWKLFRKELFRYVDSKPFNCFYCEEKMNRTWQHKKQRTVDHIVPLSKGGLVFDIDNMVICCQDCNFEKQTKSFEEFYKEKRKIA